LIRGRLPVRMVATDLRRPVGNAVNDARAAADRKGLELDYTALDAAIPVVGDDDRLQQIVANLLSNALKYTPRGGRVGVAVLPEDEQVAVRVEDTGEGIAPAACQHLFEPFFQADTTVMRAGLGLGLAIVKELVALHGGTVAAFSEGHGCGSTFAVTLPLALRSGEELSWSASTRRVPTAPARGSVNGFVSSDTRWPGDGMTGIPRS
jgi:signal transduction histidine kinase